MNHLSYASSGGVNHLQYVTVGNTTHLVYNDGSGTSIFTVAQNTSDASSLYRGQSFTPSVQGNGTGSSGSGTTVYLKDATFAWASSGSTKSNTLYLYSSVPTLTDLNAGTGALATSTGYSDGSVFGNGTYTRTYTFADVAITRTTKYYLLFPSNQSLRVQANGTYSGGDLYSTALTAVSSDAMFEATLSR